MGRYVKKMMITMISLVLLIMQIPVQGEASPNIKDLVIDLNIPQVNREVKNQSLQLKALQVLKGGDFQLAAEHLTWSSSNKNVATVNEEGEVTLTGQKGKTYIKVRDGHFSDRIAIQSKGRDGQISINKSKKERYNLIGHAISSMSLEEKVGQMLMPDFRTWKGKNVTEMHPEIEELVKEYHLGGVILFRENVVTTEQTTELVSAYQDAAEKYGLLMTIDQEGGIVTRLQSGTDMPGNMALGAARSETLSQQVGNAIGEELGALGINMNLAPVLDVNNNPDNPVIGVRSFGESPELVAQMGNAYIGGLQESGIAATAKHFPGHGDTAVDSHLGLPEVPHDLDRLKQVELYPFQQAMDAGIDAIMTAHVTFPKIDSTKAISQKDGTEISIPATLSNKVLTGLMREEMDFGGVIITDAMNMQAISDHFGPVDAAIRAVKAGTDIVLMPVGIKEVANGLYEAIRSGEITEERVEQSVERILALKINRGILKSESEASLEEKVSNALKTVGSPEHKQVEKEVANKSITLIKNEEVLPLQPAPSDKIAVIGNSYLADLASQVANHHDNVMVINATRPLTEAELSKIKQANYIILGTSTSSVAGRSANSDQMKLANQLIDKTNAPVIAVGIRNPYDIMAYPSVDAYLVQYGFRPSSFKAMADTIFGENQPSGKLPVTIFSQTGDKLFSFGHGLSY
ncbi:glycoside hydrolase family 3 C-terminal domain-containing protein [Mesobacillus foraminis]|uniref:glycoside hydrolase family 3 N-terminal domain-containing protein n=1 Tax=Mesobacillus foraminis TaxID=279826 RepID=UPI001BE68BD0|nr:glycoside hydrolase family 3 C-terminal domain-containing protein [Mesobacillus foraminis]